MNVHQRTFRSSMTSKCQVTIPKQIRDALGLKAGDRVGFELTPEGDARIVPPSREDRAAEQRARIVSGVAEARRLFRHQDPLKGISNADWFEAVRGPAAEP